MLKIKIRSEIIESARKRADKIGPNRRKIQSGSELYGMIGEELFLSNYGGTLVDSQNYDIYHPIIGKIDVKSKKCSFEPKPEYECSVAAYQIGKPECEYYVFYRVESRLNYAWYCGIMSIKDFKKVAIFHKKGDKDGNFLYKADCYNVNINQLYDIDRYV